MAKKGLEDSFSEEDDPSGARGMARAEFKLRKQGYPSALPKPIKEIMIFTPKEIGASPDADTRVKQYLEQFKNEGYNVNTNYKKMDKTGRWNYFLSFLRENDYFK
jgi:hypothetical protein